MPRPKTLPDGEVLEKALSLIHRGGPEALTFAALAEACGLSAATLVQRFGSKVALKREALLHAWDGLNEKTTRLADEQPKTPEGAIALLAALSKDYGGIESYAEGLLVLREDLRDPVLRERGKAWKMALTAALDRCLAGDPDMSAGTGMLLAAQWQGSLLWWSFDPAEPIDAYVEKTLRVFIAAMRSRRT